MSARAARPHARRGEVLLAVDAGTTSVRALAFDRSGHPLAEAAYHQRTWTERPGWVEQDAWEIAQLARRALQVVLSRPSVRRGEVVALGLTNQRESVVAVDPLSGRPLGRMVVWQDRRTAGLARELGTDGWAQRVWEQGGLPLTTYPSAPKMLWLLRHRPEVRRAAARGRLLLGTLDSWMAYQLLGGATHAAPWITDASNASRTLLYDLDRGSWSPVLLAHFEVPAETLATVRPSYGALLGRLPATGELPAGTPLAAILGDQQAGLLGVAGPAAGGAKLTLGTGAFFLADGAPSGAGPRQGLIRTVLREGADGARRLGLEGGVATAGAFLDWLTQEGLGLFPDVAALARASRRSIPGSPTTFVPALEGLFAPIWDTAAHGGLFGLTRATTRADVASAALEGIAHRIADVVEAYVQGAGRAPSPLWVDGGLARSGPLLQRIADLTGVPLAQSPVVEATARGVALAAGVSVGSVSPGRGFPSASGRRARRWLPSLARADRSARRRHWRTALGRVRSSQASEG